MKDKEFIELLNLYLDHEISAEDAVRLEAEVQREPARRKVYHDYCRLHKACTLLATDSTIQVPNIVEFTPERRTWLPKLYAGAGLMAAAACAAFVFFNRSAEVPANGGSTLAENTTVVAPPISKPTELLAAAPSASPERSIPRTVTVLAPVHTLQLTSTGAAETVQDVRLAWMEEMQLSSLPQTSVDALRFESKSTLKTTPRSLNPNGYDAAESAAWQFQR